MARRRETPQTVIHARTDPIRIVPLHLPAALALAPSAPPPQLSYRGGLLLTNVEVFTAFWGAAWQQQPQSGLSQNLNQFFDVILTSALIDQLDEYSVAGKTIGHGERVGTTIITAPVLGHSVSDGAVQHMLQQEILTNTAFPKPNPNTLYFVYLAPGVAVVQGGARSCQAFCGYHNDVNGQIVYAVMPFPDCPGSRPSKSGRTRPTPAGRARAGIGRGGAGRAAPGSGRTPAWADPPPGRAAPVSRP